MIAIKIIRLSSRIGTRVARAPLFWQTQDRLARRNNSPCEAVFLCIPAILTLSFQASRNGIQSLRQHIPYQSVHVKFLIVPDDLHPVIYKHLYSVSAV
jgi:hypothetical protein